MRALGLDTALGYQFTVTRCSNALFGPVSAPLPALPAKHACHADRTRWRWAFDTCRHGWGPDLRIRARVPSQTRGEAAPEVFERPMRSAGPRQGLWHRSWRFSEHVMPLPATPGAPPSASPSSDRPPTPVLAPSAPHRDRLLCLLPPNLALQNQPRQPAPRKKERAARTRTWLPCGAAPPSWRRPSWPAPPLLLLPLAGRVRCLRALEHCTP